MLSAGRGALIRGRHVSQQHERAALCTCRAKRYVPPGTQRRKGSGTAGGGSRPARQTKPAEDAAPDELLAELNAGGAGWLREEEEAEWGLDDVAQHARARAAREEERATRSGVDPRERRGQGGAGGGAGSGSGPGGDGRRRRSRDVAGLSDAEGEATPMASGLARVAAAEEAGSSGRGIGSGGGSAAVAAGVGVAAAAAGPGSTAAAAGGAVVEVAAAYARRNPSVLEALRLQGVTVRVQQPEPNADDEDQDPESGSISGSASASGRNRNRGRDDDDGFQDFDADDDLDLSMDLDLAADEEPGSSGATAKKAGGAGAGGAGAWMDSLAAAGFSVRTNAAGEVFLERTVTRKKPSASTSASAAAAGAGPTPESGAATASRRAAAPTAPAAGPAAAASAGSSTAAAAAGGAPAGSAAAAAAALALARQRAAAAAAAGSAAATAPSGSAAAAAAALAAARQRAAAAAAAAGQAAAPPPPPLVPPLPPLTSRPAVAKALDALSTPQQVLDFLELSYPTWAANGYRLADQRSGKPVPAPSPAEAAHCLRALALTARRSDIGGHRCLDLASGRVGQGLAEALRVTPPRIAPEHASAELSAAYFKSAQRFWLDPAGSAAAAAAAGKGKEGKGKEGKAGGGEEELVVLDAAGRTAAVDAGDEYDSLVSKYERISAEKKSKGRKKAKGRGTQEPEPGAAAAGATSSASSSSAAASTSSAEAAAAAAAAAAERHAARVECLVGALWGLSSLGGPPYFLVETEALLAILTRTLAAPATAPATPSRPAPSPASPPASASSASPPSAASPAPAPGAPLAGWEVGQVLWALGNARHVSPRLADLEEAALRAGGLAAMSPRDATRVLWGFASLGYAPSRLLGSAGPDWAWREAASGPAGPGAGGRGKKWSRTARGDVRSFSPQQLAAVVWSLAVMGRVDSPQFRSAWSSLLRRAAEVPPAEAVLTQIWQANLAIHLESSLASSSGSGTKPALQLSGSAPRGRGRGGGVSAEDLTASGLAAAAAPPLAAAGLAELGVGSAPFDSAAAAALLRKARDVFLTATAGLRRKVQSGYQRSMANCLTGMRLMHLLEDNSAGYSVDISLPQLRIALEADGPTHTSRTPGGAVLGATALKRRHLQALGWHVINVPYKDWDRLSSDLARKDYLQERINAALLSNVQLGPEEEERASRGPEARGAKA
ncbi:hypothetical protein HYH03_014187 [Edaphochlamys debaryana]|uniref:RAP domain-containing protein n=1 Tax=Edaphochlamys debaryana TaxID=47281 RepID=A0A836BTT8_9CHLO|nr:hypothetical protein HYH03_014187 [Edaphochlamys debaryana]|eukprot:KAG2487213.1 hypothetical protein HYH03_014187 [Edaphochlamys debaryana]